MAMKSLIILLTLTLGSAIPPPPKELKQHEAEELPPTQPQPSQVGPQQAVPAPRLPTQPLAENTPPGLDDIDFPWCEDYQQCGQRLLCTTPKCTENHTCCRSIEGICCSETKDASPRTARNPQLNQPRPPPNQMTPYSPSTLTLPLTIPITGNKLNIPISLPTITPNGSLDYNRKHIFPYVLDLGSLNLPPNFRPVNFVLKSVTVNPGKPSETEEYSPYYPVDDNEPIRISYPPSSLYVQPSIDPAISSYPYPEPSRYFTIPRYVIPDTLPEFSPYEQPIRSYGPRYPSTRVSYAPQPRYEEPEFGPVYRYDQPSLEDQINPVTGEMVAVPQASYPRSYRSYDPGMYPVRSQYRRLRTPHDPIYH